MHSTSAERTERPPHAESGRGDRRLMTLAAVMTLLDERADLRGVNALADHLDYAARWGI